MTELQPDSISAAAILVQEAIEAAGGRDMVRRALESKPTSKAFAEALEAAGGGALVAEALESIEQFATHLVLAREAMEAAHGAGMLAEALEAGRDEPRLAEALEAVGQERLAEAFEVIGRL